MRHKQYYANESDPINFVCIKSRELVSVTLPEGYTSIDRSTYRNLKWQERKVRMLAAKDRVKEKAAKVKAAIKE